jgi:hypothetical protein
MAGPTRAPLLDPVYRPSGPAWRRLVDLLRVLVGNLTAARDRARSAAADRRRLDLYGVIHGDE